MHSSILSTLVNIDIVYYCYFTVNIVIFDSAASGFAMGLRQIDLQTETKIFILKKKKKTKQKVLAKSMDEFNELKL